MIIGLLVQSHPIVRIFGQPLLHHMVSGLIKNALTALAPAAQAREEITPASLETRASSSPGTDRQASGEPPQGEPTPGRYC